MLRQRTSLLLVVALILAGSALTALLASRTSARAAEEEGAYQFILEETTRSHRGVREPRPSLTVYRFGEFDYRDRQFDRLEEYFRAYKEEIGIHHLLMVGFTVTAMERVPGERTTFIVQVSHADFDRLISRK